MTGTAKPKTATHAATNIASLHREGLLGKLRRKTKVLPHNLWPSCLDNNPNANCDAGAVKSVNLLSIILQVSLDAQTAYQKQICQATPAGWHSQSKHL